MKIITIANNWIYRMISIEWKLDALINKNGSLFNKINRNWQPSLIRKFNHVAITKMQSYNWKKLVIGVVVNVEKKELLEKMVLFLIKDKYELLVEISYTNLS